MFFLKRTLPQVKVPFRLENRVWLCYDPYHTKQYVFLPSPSPKQHVALTSVPCPWSHISFRRGECRKTRKTFFLVTLGCTPKEKSTRLFDPRNNDGRKNPANQSSLNIIIVILSSQTTKSSLRPIFLPFIALASRHLSYLKGSIFTLF